jgi:hypothetical protein
MGSQDKSIRSQYIRIVSLPTNPQITTAQKNLAALSLLVNASINASLRDHVP